MEAIKLASPAMQQVIQGLQALRGIAQVSAVTIAAELSEISRFKGASQLMGYSGTVPSENSSGKRRRRGSITKTGNTSETNRHRSSLELSTTARHLASVAQTAAGSGGRNQRDRLEGTTPTAQALLPGWRQRARTNGRRQQLQQQKQPHRFAGVDRVTPYQCVCGPMSKTESNAATEALTSLVRPD